MRNVIPASLFTAGVDDQALVAERSDLYGYDLFTHIDHSVTGFILKREDKQPIFVLSETNRDAEGDIESWVFLPMTGDPTGRTKVIVYND